MSTEPSKTHTCGIVMPISAIEGCTAEHWADVLAILNEAAEMAGFKGKLVSESEESGIIHKSIVQNIYASDVILCDVSCRNPNVMFELGMRLAFDLPTVLVKDDKTPYSFDTSSIEHVPYPRDLRFSQIVAFKEKLYKKLIAAREGANSKSFLKSFGQFETVKIDPQEVSADKYIVEKLDSLELGLQRLSQDVSRREEIMSVFAPTSKRAVGSVRLRTIAKHVCGVEGRTRETAFKEILLLLNEDDLDKLQEILMSGGSFEEAQQLIRYRTERVEKEGFRRNE